MGSVTVRAFLADWLAHVKDKGRPRTWTSYEQIVRVHIVPALGQKKLAQVDVLTVDKFLGACLEAGLAARSVQYVRAVLRTALNQAVKWGVIPRNVIADTTPPKVEAPEISPVSAEEARATGSFRWAPARGALQHDAW